MGRTTHLTPPMRLVLTTLLDTPDQERNGRDIATTSGVRSGTLHPVLARLERMGWLASRWEDIDPHVEGRPACRLYRLTAAGLPRAGHALEPGRPGRPDRSPVGVPRPAGEQG